MAFGFIPAATHLSNRQALQAQRKSGNLNLEKKKYIENIVLSTDEPVSLSTSTGFSNRNEISQIFWSRIGQDGSRVRKLKIPSQNFLGFSGWDPACFTNPIISLGKSESGSLGPPSGNWSSIFSGTVRIEVPEGRENILQKFFSH